MAGTSPKYTLTVTKEVEWEMSHRLSKHKGQCKNLHGHTYKLQATFGTIGSKLTNGMLVDFSTLKEVLNAAVVSKLDHACLLDGRADDTRIGTALKDLNLKFMYLDCEPTAENMVILIAQWISNALDYFKADLNVVLIELKLYETPTSYVTWRRA